MSWKLNPFTGTLDLDTGLTSGAIPSITDSLYLKLDQTVPQTVSSGMPTFDGGMRSNNNIVLKSGMKFILDGA
jgi:hypothetical protein